MFAILNYPKTLSLVSITSLPLITIFWFIIFHLKLNIDKTEGKFQVCSRSILGYICEIFAVLYYLNLDTCIDNVPIIDCSILV